MFQQTPINEALDIKKNDLCLTRSPLSNQNFKLSSHSEYFAHKRFLLYVAVEKRCFEADFWASFFRKFLTAVGIVTLRLDKDPATEPTDIQHKRYPIWFTGN